MCGIAGIATTDGLHPSDERLVGSMLVSIAHRGPDDQQCDVDSHAAIGVRRLSIIDLDTGRQPIPNEDGSVVVSQNGEIYNYVELRDDLRAAGHKLTTKGDTETIVHLYEDLGERFVERLRGMFAIAIWDRRERRLVLARDRLGKKPIYWCLANGRLIYGSELKTILCDPDVPRVVDRSALADYLQYGYVPAPKSILQGIHKLPPASVLVWDGGQPRVHRYWTPSYETKTRGSYEEDRETCLEILKESVRIRLRSDVPLGVFLSGGVDSSTVTALMAEASSTPVKTFSIGFEEQRYNELPYAGIVARHFGTDHVEEVVRLDALALLPQLARHYDEPFSDSSALPTFRVAQLAAAQVKVVLTGDGGDETFAGYERYRFQAAMDISARLPSPTRRLLAASGQQFFKLAHRDRLRRRTESWSYLSSLDRDTRYVGLMSTFGSEMRAMLLRDPIAASQDGYLRDVLQAGPAGTIDRLLRADTLTYLPEDLLVKMDRATMASSLEARSPLLDHKLVEFAAALPVDRKMRLGRTKILLRDIATRLLPRGAIDRPKRGFGVPIDSWFRSDLGDLFRDVVLGPASASRDHLDTGLAATLLDDHTAGRGEHANRLWNLLMFELWCRTYLGAATPTERAA
jgi:asparagine synthase (glutamine-hydrolysing)